MTDHLWKAAEMHFFVLFNSNPRLIYGCLMKLY